MAGTGALAVPLSPAHAQVHQRARESANALTNARGAFAIRPFIPRLEGHAPGPELAADATRLVAARESAEISLEEVDGALSEVSETVDAGSASDAGASDAGASDAGAPELNGDKDALVTGLDESETSRIPQWGVPPGQQAQVRQAMLSAESAQSTQQAARATRSGAGKGAGVGAGVGVGLGMLAGGLLGGFLGSTLGIGGTLGIVAGGALGAAAGGLLGAASGAGLGALLGRRGSAEHRRRTAASRTERRTRLRGWGLPADASIQSAGSSPRAESDDPDPVERDTLEDPSSASDPDSLERPSAPLPPGHASPRLEEMYQQALEQSRAAKAAGVQQGPAPTPEPREPEQEAPTRLQRMGASAKRGARWLGDAFLFRDQEPQTQAFVPLGGAGPGFVQASHIPLPAPVVARDPNPSPVAKLSESTIETRMTSTPLKGAIATQKKLKKADKEFFEGTAGRLGAGAVGGAVGTGANLLYTGSHLIHAAEIATLAAAREDPGLQEWEQSSANRNRYAMDQMHLDVASMKVASGRTTVDQAVASDVPVPVPMSPQDAEMMHDYDIAPELHKRLDGGQLAQRSAALGREGATRRAFSSTAKAVRANLRLAAARQATGQDTTPEWPMDMTVGERPPATLVRKLPAEGDLPSMDALRPAHEGAQSSAEKMLESLQPSTTRPVGNTADLSPVERAEIDRLSHTIAYFTAQERSGELDPQRRRGLDLLTQQVREIYASAEVEEQYVSRHEGQDLRRIGHAQGTEVRAGGLDSDPATVTPEDMAATVGGRSAQALRGVGKVVENVGTVIEGRPEEGRKAIDNRELGYGTAITASGLGQQAIAAYPKGGAHIANVIQYSARSGKYAGQLIRGAGDRLAGGEGGQDQRDMQRELMTGERSGLAREEGINWQGEKKQARPSDLTKREAVRRVIETGEAILDTGALPLPIAPLPIEPLHYQARLQPFGPMSQVKKQLVGSEAGTLAAGSLTGMGAPQALGAAAAGAVDLTAYQNIRKVDNDARPAIANALNDVVNERTGGYVAHAKGSFDPLSAPLRATAQDKSLLATMHAEAHGALSRPDTALDQTQAPQNTLHSIPEEPGLDGVIPDDEEVRSKPLA